MEKRVTTVIMAAGEGVRMKSKLPKMLHSVCGRPIIDYVVDAALDICDDAPILVVGHGAEAIKEHLGDKVRYTYQEEQLGTGHAVMMAQKYLEGMDGYVVVLAGDTPLITGKLLGDMVNHAVEHDYSCVALSAIVEDPTGYGRIIRDANGDFSCIVEHKDATYEQRQVKEINASMYCFKVQDLLESLKKLDNNNAQHEYYLTDVLKILTSENKRVGIYCADDASYIMGINTRIQLSQADKLMRLRINNYHMDNGVTIIDPENTYIGPNVHIGQDTIIYPGNVIEGDTYIGEECILYPNSRLINTKVDDKVIIQNSVVLNSQIGEETTIGPFAYIRPGSIIGGHVRIGDFVEVKNAAIGDGTKVSHLTYVGDANVGNGVNVGCGVVFVNYDGKGKHRTVVEDNAFIGCNTNLVAPVKVEQNSYIAAGSTITKTVPKGALAIARARQENKEGWVEGRNNR